MKTMPVYKYGNGTFNRIVTYATFVWFLSCVDSHVFFKGPLLSKRLDTQVTFLPFLSTVKALQLY